MMKDVELLLCCTIMIRHSLFTKLHKRSKMSQAMHLVVVAVAALCMCGGAVRATAPENVADTLATQDGDGSDMYIGTTISWQAHSYDDMREWLQVNRRCAC